MYAQMLKGQLKPEKFDFVTQTMEKEVIPLLKKQHGFRDELSFFDRNVKEGYQISLWENKADLEKYEREVYPKVRDKIASAFEKQPVSHDYEVSNSTWHKIHAA